eukprot:1336533-Amorphochlora_amoeboformis.AAC.1
MSTHTYSKATLIFETRRAGWLGCNTAMWSLTHPTSSRSTCTDVQSDAYNTTGATAASHISYEKTTGTYVTIPEISSPVFRGIPDVADKAIALCPVRVCGLDPTGSTAGVTECSGS